MAHKFSTDRFTFGTANAAIWPLTGIFALFLVLNAVAQPPRSDGDAQSKDTKQSTNTQSRDNSAAEKKFEEGESLRAQGTLASLRLAVKTYEEALLLWKAIGDRSGE